MYKKAVPKLNKKNIFSWKSKMRLYLSGMGDYALRYLENDYNPPPLRLMNVEKMKEKLEHKTLMIEIAFSLTGLEYDDIKNFSTTKEMCEKLAVVYGGEQDIMRVKAKIRRKV